MHLSGVFFFSPPLYSLRFISSAAVSVVAALPRGGAVGLHKSGQWKRIKDTKILKRFAKQQVAVLSI